MQKFSHLSSSSAKELLMKSRNKRIAIFVSFSGQGGVERAMALLAEGMLSHGVTVDFILPKAVGDHVRSIPKEVNVIRLDSKHTFSALVPLARYLKKERPDALLASKHRAIVTAVLASRLAGFRGVVAGNIQTTISAGLADSNLIKRNLYFGMMRFFYKWAHFIVAVSKGVADDIIQITGLPSDKIKVIYNPVVTPDIEERAAEPVDNALLMDDTIPVILGIGRLTKQKDFHTLIRAFIQVRKTRHCRLVILGDGGDLDTLRSLARDGGVEDDVAFPGFQNNPFAWLAKSNLFVLSSRWEGFGIVIVEALALGIPVVSTDCPNGPSEILKDGKYGSLVPVEDPTALSEAILRALENPLSPEILKKAAEEYTAEKIGGEYIQMLLS